MGESVVEIRIRVRVVRIGVIDRGKRLGRGGGVMCGGGGDRNARRRLIGGGVRVVRVVIGGCGGVSLLLVMHIDVFL